MEELNPGSTERKQQLQKASTKGTSVTWAFWSFYDFLVCMSSCLSCFLLNMFFSSFFLRCFEGLVELVVSLKLVLYGFVGKYYVLWLVAMLCQWSFGG